MAAEQVEKKQPARAGKSRVRPVKDGHLPVSEFLFGRQGPASPFGEDMTFPLPVDRLPYTHPPVLDADD